MRGRWLFSNPVTLILLITFSAELGNLNILCEYGLDTFMYACTVATKYEVTLNLRLIFITFVI